MDRIHHAVQGTEDAAQCLVDALLTHALLGAQYTDEVGVRSLLFCLLVQPLQHSGVEDAAPVEVRGQVEQILLQDLANLPPQCLFNGLRSNLASGKLLAMDVTGEAHTFPWSSMLLV
jgi:hypothetical protein